VRAHGIHVTAGFIVGLDGERRAVFETQLSFIQASGIGVAIPGLLQALPGTQLARRLDREGRLVASEKVSLISTVEGINYIPRGEMTKREYLERYRLLIKDVFSPEAFFARIVPAVRALRGISHAMAARILRKQLPTVLRLFYVLGIQGAGYRRLFWMAFLRVLVSNPTALEAFGHDCFYFYHLSQHVRFIDRELRRHLATAGADPALDEVLPDAPAVAAA
jgi:hypothetical protein